MNKYFDCDYFFDKVGNIYLVKGYFHPSDFVHAKMIYRRDDNGNREDLAGRHYFKDLQDNVLLVPEKEIDQYFKPREATIKENLEGVWKEIYQYLWQKIGIPKNDIGVFGSALVGFPVIHDVDFIIYGIDNCIKTRSSISQMKHDLGFGEISDDHIAYQAQKFSSSHDASANTLEKMLKNKWSSMQMKPGLLNTLVFGLNDNEISEIFNAIDRPGEEVKIIGEVSDDLYTSFCPRVFKIKSGAQEYVVKDVFWAMHQCVTTGQKVQITGKDIGNNEILINKYGHGVAIL